MEPTGRGSEMVDGVGAVATGLGLVTFALFPLALPFLILTVAATLPLLLPLIALALLGGFLAAIWLALRATGRGVRRLAGHRAGERAPVGARAASPRRASARIEHGSG